MNTTTTAVAVVYLEDPDDSELICPVCRGQFDEGTTTSRLMCCRNEVCAECHAALADRHVPSCPICRAALASPPSSPDLDGAVVIADSDSDSDSDSDGSNMDEDEPAPSYFADTNGVDSETESESDPDDDDFVPGEPQPTTVWSH
jgi:hypothetical protein